MAFGQRIIRGDDEREVYVVARAPYAAFAEDIAFYPLGICRAAHVEITQRQGRARFYLHEGDVPSGFGRDDVRFVLRPQHGPPFGIGARFGQHLVLPVVGPDFAAPFGAGGDQVGRVDDVLVAAAALADEADVGLHDHFRPLLVGPVIPEIIVVVVFVVDGRKRVDTPDFEQVHRLAAVGDQAAEVERIGVALVEPGRRLGPQVDGRVADDARHVIHG